MAVKPVTDEYPGVIPYLISDDVEKQMNFLTKVFGAVQEEKMFLLKRYRNRMNKDQSNNSR